MTQLKTQNYTPQHPMNHKKIVNHLNVK